MPLEKIGPPGSFTRALGESRVRSAYCEVVCYRPWRLPVRGGRLGRVELTDQRLVFYLPGINRLVRYTPFIVFVRPLVGVHQIPLAEIESIDVKRWPTWPMTSLVIRLQGGGVHCAVWPGDSFGPHRWAARIDGLRRRRPRACTQA